MTGFGTQDTIFTTEEQRRTLTVIVEVLSTTAFSLAINSTKTSVSAMRCFARFLVAYGHTVLTGKDVSDAVLAEFIVWMALSGKHKSIRTYVSMGPRIVVENMGVKFRKISERVTVHRVM